MYFKFIILLIVILPLMYINLILCYLKKRYYQKTKFIKKCKNTFVHFYIIQYTNIKIFNNLFVLYIFK